MADRKLSVTLKYTAKGPKDQITLLKYICSMSPYFETGQKKNYNRAYCPFQMIYRYDEEEYFLSCYDEMHNHVLSLEPRIMPM